MPTALKDIEAMLTARPDVEDSTVVEYDAEGPILVLVKPNNFCSGLELRDECGTALGDAGSRVIVALTNDLPRPPYEFPDPESVLGDAAYVYRYEPPTTDTEKLMVSLWNDVLGRRVTGVTDDFLDLGGDSVLAVRIVARISQDFGVDVSIAAFFDAVSIREVAALVDDVRSRRNLLTVKAARFGPSLPDGAPARRAARTPAAGSPQTARCGLAETAVGG